MATSAGRPRRRQGRVQPADGLVVQVAAVLAGHGGVAQRQGHAVQVMELVDRPLAAVLVAEQHPPEAGPPVVVARADQHRRRPAQQLAGHLVFGRLAVVGHVAGHQDGVDRPGRGRQVAHHPLGAGRALLPAVDVEVADLRQEHHRRSFRWPPGRPSRRTGTAEVATAYHARESSRPEGAVDHFTA